MKIYFEMFSKAGEKACEGLVNRLTKKIQGKKRLTLDEIEELVDKGMDKIALKHPEIWDTEPKYHIRKAINKAAKDVGYQEIYCYR